MTSLADFVGRRHEIALLSRMLDGVRETRRGAFLSVRGRRRVGKSRLVEEFARASGSSYVYYVSTRQESAQELGRFQEAVRASALPTAEGMRGTAFETWEAALTLAGSGASWEHPAIVVVDEFPYLTERDPNIEAVVQKVWDRSLQAQPVMLILIGSDVATMEALSEHGRPLYDRPRELVVQPLTPADVASIVRLDGADALDAYLAIGGFPELALAWGPGRKLWEFLGEALEDPTSPLIVSAERALRAEFPTQAQARTVLSLVGVGERAFTAIQARAGLPRTSLDRALHLLAEKHVAQKQLPYAGRAASGSGRWLVSDPYLRFWLRFVEPNVELVERGRGRLALELVRRDWEGYRGRAIEPIVRASIERMLPAEHFGDARFVGGYWTRDNRVEVDLVGGTERSAPTPVSFVGSVKWRQDAPFNRTDAAVLASTRAAIPGAGPATPLVGVSRGAFDDAGVLDVELSADELLAAWR
jgi:AAA+ ATPase superfamily predicted ATPase